MTTAKDSPAAVPKSLLTPHSPVDSATTPAPAEARLVAFLCSLNASFPFDQLIPPLDPEPLAESLRELEAACLTKPPPSRDEVCRHVAASPAVRDILREEIDSLPADSRPAGASRRDAFANALWGLCERVKDEGRPIFEHRKTFAESLLCLIRAKVLAAVFDRRGETLGEPRPYKNRANSVHENVAVPAERLLTDGQHAELEAAEEARAAEAMRRFRELNLESQYLFEQKHLRRRRQRDLARELGISDAAMSKRFGRIRAALRPPIEP